MVKQAIILAGGLGTRLGSLTEKTPKPLLPVDGRPFVAYLIDWLALHGVEDVVLAIGHLAEQFNALLDDNSWSGPTGTSIRVRLVVEPKPAGTGGALHYVSDLLDDRFLFLNGDTWFDMDLLSLMQRGASLQDGEALMALRHVESAGRYGGVALVGERIAAFNEKGSDQAGLINAGVSIMTRGIADRVSALPCSLETDIFPELVAVDQLYGLAQSGYMIDIGLPKTLDEAKRELTRRMRRPLALLDRDGVLNINHGYVHRADEFEWVDGAIDAIRTLRAAGLKTVVVTNQAGVARGFYDEAAIKTLHDWVNETLRRHGAQIDRFYYAPYHPEGVVLKYAKTHEDRKPGPGMLLRALDEFSAPREGSFLIGDQPSDITAAERAGVPGFLFEGGNLNAFVEDLQSSGRICL